MDSNDYDAKIPREFDRCRQIVKIMTLRFILTLGADSISLPIFQSIVVYYVDAYSTLFTVVVYFSLDISNIEIGCTMPVIPSIISFTLFLDQSGCTMQYPLPDWSVPVTRPFLKYAV